MKELAIKSNSQSLIPETNMVEEENQYLQVVLSMCTITISSECSSVVDGRTYIRPWVSLYTLEQECNRAVCGVAAALRAAAFSTHMKVEHSSDPRTKEDEAPRSQTLAELYVPRPCLKAHKQKDWGYGSAVDHWPWA